jgi:phosphatidylinositol alpha-1,6-mannosyltransferase
MSIFIVSKPVAPPWNDGPKNMVYDLMRHLPHRQFHVLGEKGRPLDLPNVVTEEIHPPSTRYLPSLTDRGRAMKRLLKPDPEVDFYHFFMMPTALNCRFARLLGPLKRKKVIVTVTTHPSTDNWHRWLFGDRVVVLSQWARSYTEQFGVETQLIYPGIESVRSSFSPNHLVQKLGLEGRFVVLYAGDYEFTRAAYTIADAIKAVADRVKNVCFVFACRLKTSRARVVEADVKGRIERLGLGSSAVFLNEVEPMDALLEAADVFIFPVDSVKMKVDIPLVLLEAMAHAKPIVTTELPSLVETVGEAAVKVPPGNSDALARAILQLVEDEGQRESLGQLGREIVHARFGAKRMAHEYDQLYRELLEGG